MNLHENNIWIFISTGNIWILLRSNLWRKKLKDWFQSDQLYLVNRCEKASIWKSVFRMRGHSNSIIFPQQTAQNLNFEYAAGRGTLEGGGVGIAAYPRRVMIVSEAMPIWTHRDLTPFTTMKPYCSKICSFVRMMPGSLLQGVQLQSQWPKVMRKIRYP